MKKPITVRFDETLLSKVYKQIEKNKKDHKLPHNLTTLIEVAVAEYLTRNANQ